MKLCSKCKQNQTYTTSSWCKECRRESARLKRLEKGQKPKIVFNDPPGQKICRHCKIAKNLNEFYKADPNHSKFGVASYCKVCRPFRCPPDKQKAALATANYRKNNKAEYLAKHRIAQAKRRGLVVVGSLSKADAEALYAKEFCRYCRKYVFDEDRTIDHVIPLKKGGLHNISNLDMACWSCNCSKRDKTEEEFLQFMRAKDANFGQSNC